jgi:hypothetical protein
MKIYKTWGKIKYYFLDFKNRLESLLYWLPVIWSSSGDYIDTYRIFKHQLKRQRLNLDSRIKGYGKHIKDLRTCELLLERLIEDEYIICSYDGNNNSYIFRYYVSPLFKREIPDNKIVEFLRNRSSQDKKLLFKILERKIETF